MPVNKRERAAAPSQRQRRVAELVKQELSLMLTRGEIHDDVLASHVISVPEVRLTPDLKLATIYILPLGGKDAGAVLNALETHRRFIRSELAHRINLRFAPDIRFRADASFEEGMRIDALLDSEKVRRDTGKPE